MSARTERRVFPLVSRWRLAGIPFGEQRSVRRGPGSDIAGSRPYRPGDPVTTIDWNASARLSAARGSDEFIVRERYADEAPRVVLVCDRRPAMALYGPPFPWLDKARAQHAAAEAIVASALVSRSEVGWHDFAGGEPYWLAPTTGPDRWLLPERLDATPYDAPEEALADAFAFLARVRADLPGGTFVFVLSDFLAPLPVDAWLGARAERWDAVPVVIQDPVWERSFPDVASVVVPVADPATGRVEPVRLSAREARERRREHEERHERLLTTFAAVGLDPVVLDVDDPLAIDERFVAWAERRRRARTAAGARA